ncbi:hypothetical protein [Helicobacter pylori]|uniref:hypothetical protein n=1 Tax=Helicobacter pylori TaxID=210 RepID=UPI000FDE3405|nr:hypothetical protein [Helicobacter pylori]RVZ53321.1 hypothetical protein EC557_03040 [Helicobacter pylori]RVZ91774.1 hypothetical protein EDC85_03320 [Helicobacter pylori]
MRQEHETPTSFNQLKEITQIMQAQKTSLKTSENANASERVQESAINPKDSVKAKKGALKPTKRAFSERQKTAFRDHSQACANKSFKTKISHNANAFKTEQGLKNNQSNQKGGKNEA